MIDLRRLADDPAYRVGIERKRVAPGLLDDVIALDARYRALDSDVQALRARQNAASKEIGRASAEDRPAKIEAAARLKEELGAAESALTELEPELRALVLQVPNPADASVPDGGEDEGEVVREVGTLPAAPPPADHAAFAENAGWVDRERAAEIAGSRFAYLMGDAVLLEFALLQWVLSKVVAAGYTPVVPPVLVRERTMEEAGFFPTDRAQVYEVDGGELFLVGTAEVPLAMLHRQETVTADALPLRYVGYSSCFRREAGTYGKDTRGIFRVHQFDKLEMFVFCDPDSSWDEHDRILAMEESIVGGLGLPYRVVNVAAGDLGPAAAKKFDIEVWLPSEGRYREATSCSNYLEYSARRVGTRVKSEHGTQLVHTLNGTACAISRTLVYLFEHYQDPDGGFRIPEVLQPHMGGRSYIAPPT
ncbi:MAG TPA: serine--tRNA ligase [Acidimicrobiia bacterium]